MLTMAPPLAEHRMRSFFGDRLQVQAALAPYTSSRLGGEAEFLVTIRSIDELVAAAEWLWASEAPFTILGSGSNVLISDEGVRGVVLLNRARRVIFELDAQPPRVSADSGANFGALARQAASKGLAGLAWAAGIPGTVGGAVVGNAGAHGGDIAGNLIVAEILHRSEGRHAWNVERLEYAYRQSALKRRSQEAIVLSATLRLENSSPGLIQDEMDRLLAYRRRTQPPGASMGSMFKNPADDYAGRLIDAVGLKGTRIGGAQISPLHANFFINRGDARATDVLALIHLARTRVFEQFGIQLELEIELLGEWASDEK